nr:thioredoxin family protein [Bacteroidota bacterium]
MREKIKKIFKSVFILLVVSIIVALFVFRDALTDYASKGLQNQITPISKMIFADSITQMFDYSGNGKHFNYTLLEFGAKNCVSCRKMEKVLEEIRNTQSSKINVVFYNMTLTQGLQWGKYFGVVMIPTQIILDRKGNEVFRNTGYIPADELLLHLEK